MNTLTVDQDIVLNQIPPTRQLQRISQIDDPPFQANNNSQALQPHTAQSQGPVLLGGRIPPIPAELAKRITKGHYVDMAELHPEHLEELNTTDEDHPKSSRMLLAVATLKELLTFLSVLVVI